MEFRNSGRPEANYFFQDMLFDKYLVPAAKKAGYDVANPLGSEPIAGNIHARMGVEISTTLADLFE
jgi:hypothetical protein